MFEYLQEVQVKTGGIAAEYGGALGGVISAVTKSGGNTLHGEGHYYYSRQRRSAPARCKRLVLEPDRRQDRAATSRTTKQTNNRNEFGGSIGGPIVQGQAVLLRIGVAALRPPHEQLPVLERHRARARSIRARRVTQAFGKVTYASRPHARERQRARRRRRVRPARCRPTTAPAPNFDHQLAAPATRPTSRAGSSRIRRNVSGNVDFIADAATSFISVRGGIFYDNYKDTGIPTTTSCTSQHDRRSASPGVPAESAAAESARRTRRACRSPTSTRPKRGFFQVDYNQAFNAAGSHTLKGGYGVPAHDRTTWTRRTRRLRAPRTGARRSPATRRVRRGTGTYGYYEVNDRGTRRQASARTSVALRAGRVDGRQPPDAEPRRPHREAKRFRRSGPTSSDTRSSSASATSSRRASARPTTCAATAA